MARAVPVGDENPPVFLMELSGGEEHVHTQGTRLRNKTPLEEEREAVLRKGYEEHNGITQTLMVRYIENEINKGNLPEGYLANFTKTQIPTWLAKQRREEAKKDGGGPTGATFTQLER